MSAALWPDARAPKPRPLPAALKPLAAARDTITDEPLGPTAVAGVRTIRIGLLGLGQVGQAVARLAPAADRFAAAGLRFRVDQALVRDIDRPRRCPKPSRLTTNPAAFLRGNYDVVIEALGAIEPARSIVSRLLGRGIPVATANKALVAAHGAELAALAARRGTSLRYEASALAGVPFLGTLAARPLVSDVHQFAAIVNGTSNFILSKLESDGCSFDEALAAAQALGLTEPDPSRDLDGLDAADKVSLLATLFGWGPIPSGAADVQGIRDLTAEDLAVAHTLGATIKPLVWAARREAALEVFIGPALVPARHPLGTLAGTLNGIQFSGRYVQDLFFSGPGAGPDVTAATMLDDAVEAVTSAPRFPRVAGRAAETLPITSPATRWFIRARFPGLVPDASAAREAFHAHGLSVRHVTDSIHDARWLLVDEAARDQVTRALAVLRDTHRLQCLAIRAI